MTSPISLFKCEAVSAGAPEFIVDDTLGELQMSTMPAELERPQTEPVLIDDPELGPLVLGPAPAVKALPRRTGPPRRQSPKIAGGR
ncbi:hypothetical protein FHT98_1803 [Bosea sp. AK1]|nr:hypothetical protein FHT98_1803 [Bosea sp. AK1]